VRRFLTFLLVAGLLCGAALVSSGCKTGGGGIAPPLSNPPTVVAAYGANVSKSIRAIQSTIIGLDPVLSAYPGGKAGAVKAVDACVQAQKVALKLADALTTYQNAVDALAKAAAAKDVNGIVLELEPLLVKILDPISPTVAGARKQISDLITETMKLIWAIRANVPVLVPVTGGA